MNLYAIVPSHAPNNEVSFVLAGDEDQAMQQGIFVAALDVAKGNYFSPSAQVYLVAADLLLVGEALATDAPAEWDWAHPAVEENAARQAKEQADWDAGVRDAPPLSHLIPEEAHE